MKAAMSPVAADGIQYRFAHATHRGLVREQNEDAIAIAEHAGLALVADGMGGYNAGEVASGLAAEFLVTHLVDDLDQLRRQSTDTTELSTQRMLHALLRARIDGANEAIIDAANRDPDLCGMGTTLSMLLFTEQAVTTLHVGDSRVYRLRDGVLSLLTRDHSLLQEQIDAGVLTPGEARLSINRNFVTRALGVDVVAEPEINEYDLVPGDLYLICSDGLPDMLSDEEIYDLLCIEGTGCGQDDDEMTKSEQPGDGRVADIPALEEVAAKLVDAANGRGGRDNVSVVLASVGWSRDPTVRDEGRPVDRDSREPRRA
jgi:serine/threonine protein phosphatase PrpC